MYLYRVEHKKTREGPYAYIGPMQDVKPHLYYMDDHPSPYDEGLDFWMGINQCGFESKKKLLDWFTIKDLEDFEKDNLHVYKIHTEERWVEKGRRQLIFNPDFNYYRKRIPLKDLRQYKAAFVHFGGYSVTQSKRLNRAEIWQTLGSEKIEEKE
jgi:hypothetical protein